MEAVAVCFLHSYLNDSHERLALDLVKASLPNVYVVGSAALWPQLSMYDRVSTVALSAYVGPKLDRYLTGLMQSLAELGFAGTLLIMKSNGGVMTPELARRTAVGTLLSGPAGGPRAALAYVAPLSLDRCITVDMGGTSTDSCLILDGQPLVVPYGDIDRLRIAMPMLDIHTIGAGGGSIAWINEAGLSDGPAECWGRSRTSLLWARRNRHLHRRRPGAWVPEPRLLPWGQDEAPGGPCRAGDSDGDSRASRNRRSRGTAGMYEVVNVNMAAGISEVSIAKGQDPREFPLVVAGERPGPWRLDGARAWNSTAGHPEVLGGVLRGRHAFQ